VSRVRENRTPGSMRRREETDTSRARTCRTVLAPPADPTVTLGEQDRNGRYVEKGASGQWPLLPAGEPRRQEARGLERQTQWERRHGDSVQFIPHDAGRGADDAGVTHPILRVWNHVVEIHDQLANRERRPIATCMITRTLMRSSGGAPTRSQVSRQPDPRDPLPGAGHDHAATAGIPPQSDPPDAG
jgi:hypothetical protein